MNPHLNLLTKYLEIPSVSALPEFLPDMQRARQYLLDLFSSLGFTSKILPSAVHPAIYSELITNNSLPTVLVYGHYDVQPPGAPSLWTSPAFIPEIRRNKIYARGASDNKGQFMIHVLAIKNLIDKYGKNHLPVNFKFIVEGEEEIGSPGVENLVLTHPDLFKCDYVFLSDTEMVSPGHPSIDISLRGVMDMEISVQIGSHDLHSGQFGGIAPNAGQIMINLLSRLKNGHGRILIPGFYRNIKNLSAKELTDFNLIEPKARNILSEGHFYYIDSAEPGLTLNRRRWSEPTLDITGLDSGYTGNGTKTVIPHLAEAKLSFRLVPDQDPDQIYHSIISFLQKLTPKHAVLSIVRSPYAKPYKAPISHPVYKLVKTALKDTFKNSAVFTGQGGSIGFIPVLAEILGVPCVLVGFGLPDDNCHAPNEFLLLENFEKGITAMQNIYSFVDTIK